MMLLPVLLASLLAPSGPALGVEERAIIEAVLTFGQIKPAPQTLLPAGLPLFVLDDHPRALFLDTQEVFSISDELIAALREANQQRASLKDVAKPRTKRGSVRETLSRPGIPRDHSKA